jgi:CRP/FNR family cyclic AMP-dependent transcriptional regulator
MQTEIKGDDKMISHDFLKQTEIFNNLNDLQLQKLSGIASSEKHSAGSVLFREGQPASHFYIVEEGAVSLQMGADMGPGRLPVLLTMATVTKGQGIGWSVFADPHKYTASAQCEKDSTLLAFRADQLRELLNQEPALGYEVAKGVINILASRLNSTREMLFDEEVMDQLRKRGETLL